MNWKKGIMTLAFGVLLTSSLLFAGCGGNASAPAGQEQSATIKVKTAQGEVEVPKNPQRVVVLDYGSLDTMDALGVKVESLGLSTQIVPSYLSQYKDIGKNIGSPKDPDFEAISRLEPQLIIMTRRNESAYEELRKIAPTIDLSVDHENYRSSVAQNVTTIGEIFGKEAEAKAALEKLEAKMDEVKAQGTKAGKGLFVMTTGGKLHAFGPDTRYGLLYNELKLDSVVDKGNGDPTGHGQIISFEYIAERNPDYILVLDRDAAIGQGGAGKATMDNALVQGTKAAKNGKIIYLDPGLWYLSGGGLESTEKMLEALQTVL